MQAKNAMSCQRPHQKILLCSVHGTGLSARCTSSCGSHSKGMSHTTKHHTVIWKHKDGPALSYRQPALLESTHPACSVQQGAAVPRAYGARSRCTSVLGSKSYWSGRETQCVRVKQQGDEGRELLSDGPTPCTLTPAAVVQKGTCPCVYDVNAEQCRPALVGQK